VIHYYAELALWIAAFFLAGCPLGALARRIAGKRAPPTGGGA